MMSRNTCLAIALLFGITLPAAADEPAPGKQVAAKLPVKVTSSDAVAESDLHYLIFLPEGYSKEKKFPLMLFLHGAGERGDNDLPLVKKHGPPKLVESTRKDFPFILISPQCPKGSWWNSEHLFKLLDEVESKYSVDKSQVYVTGLSMGGFGTWKMTAEQPKRFAAAIPICGGGDPKTAEKLVDLPIWVFHGDKDTAVKLEQSEKMVNAIKEAGGKSVKLTVYPGVGHDSWTETYNNKEVYEWLLSHKRKS